MKAAWITGICTLTCIGLIALFFAGCNSAPPPPRPMPQATIITVVDGVTLYRVKDPDNSDLIYFTKDSAQWDAPTTDGEGNVTHHRKQTR